MFSPSVYCPSGMYIIDNQCQDCPQDTYKGASEYYATGCHICPDVSPKTRAAGSTSIDDCRYGKYF